MRVALTDCVEGACRVSACIVVCSDCRRWSKYKCGVQEALVSCQGQGRAARVRVRVGQGCVWYFELSPCRLNLKEMEAGELALVWKSGVRINAGLSSVLSIRSVFFPLKV